MNEPLFPIKTVAQRTGLSAHVIRIWEKRYHAVEPGRTGTNRRLYSEADITRLSTLRELTQTGRNISSIAAFPTDRLLQLLEAGAPAQPASTEQRSYPVSDDSLEDALSAVRALDPRALDAALRKAEVRLGSQGMLQRVAAPLAQAVGTAWREGTLTAAHEHFSTAILRVYLGHSARSFAPSPEAPVLITATPAGQLHEIGALLAGATAANLGWRVIHLGANLPAAEIAGAAGQSRARAIALSIVHPEDDPRLEGELLKLGELVPSSTRIIAGGRAASAFSEPLARINATVINDLPGLGECLDSIRATKGPKQSAD